MKFSIRVVFIFLIFSCSNKSNQKVTERTFKNKTFISYFESEKDSLIIEFTDSTYQYIDHGKVKRSWHVTNYNNSTFLVLDKIAIGIEQLNDSTLKCFNVSYEDAEFEMRLRKPKWNKEQLYGKWVDEKYHNQPESFFPPIPPPYPENGYSWPPFYEISESKIVSDHYFINESEFNINSSNEFMVMTLKSHIVGKEIKWKIKSVTDSTMVINRFVEKANQKFEHLNTYSEDIKLITIK